VVSAATEVASGLRSRREMTVAGVMSGTSADGINVALLRIERPSPRSRHRTPEFKYLSHAEYPYPIRVRQTVLKMMNATSASVADLSRLNFLLAELYAEAVRHTEREFRTRVDLVGCHGQTLYHQGEAQNYLGRTLACTWQIGDGSILAARLGVPVVSDFRPADMAAGGKGAPLVPFLDYILYRHENFGRVVQNLGGIGNLTAIPKGANANRILAFDTGPGNMVIDAVTERLFARSFDRGGMIAASGRVLETVIHRVLRSAFFERKPPKTAGREEFGRDFVTHFLKLCGRARKEDAVATATALTAESVGVALSKFVLKNSSRYREYIVSGGGTNNPTLMAMLANRLRPLELELRVTDEFGLPSSAKEAVAFALLAYQTWNHLPSNVPSATGAKRPAILGKVSYA
jgi:anhydro-N-acetylmuramic acid kinase